jgi:iron complex transport system ATP-binding protein
MTDIISCHNLSFSYGKHQVLENLNASFKAGHIYCLLGINGSGKTTFLNCLAGFLEIAKGSISICEKDLTQYSIREIAKKIAYVPQLSQITQTYTVRDYVSFGRTPYIGTFSFPSKKDFEIVDHKLADCGITNLANQAVDELSGGQLQLVLIAKALTQETPIILLDEPTSALDLPNQSLILHKLLELRNSGKTIIMTTHDPNQVLFLQDCAAFVDGKKLKCLGSVKETFSSENLKSIFGDSVKLAQISENDRVCLLK